MVLLPKASDRGLSAVFYHYNMSHVDDCTDTDEGESPSKSSPDLDFIKCSFYPGRLFTIFVCAWHCGKHFLSLKECSINPRDKKKNKKSQTRPTRPWHFWGNQPNLLGRLHFIFLSSFPIIAVRFFASGMAPPCHHLPELFIYFLPLKAKLKQARINSMSQQLCP